MKTIRRDYSVMIAQAILLIALLALLASGVAMILAH
jgi:hypothetical protein